MKKFVLIFLFCMNAAFAAEDFYTFSSPAAQQQFEQLTTHLRCLVCQNQTIAESNAGLAVDLREQIYLQIQQGKSSDDILNFLVARYGNYILYQPPLKLSTMALWFLPFLTLLVGIGYLLHYIRRERKAC